VCGIAGIVSGTGSRELVGRMLDRMVHRGPDGEGISEHAVSPECVVTLGHRRLAIIDLSESASQPMFDATGRFAIVFNGEIYNYLEVRAELARLGASFVTSSDTEVILEAYKRWGVECLSRLNGMFAFGLFDGPARKLFCARDRYGEKPFLFSRRPGRFAFASEYKALLQDPGLPLELDEWRLVQAAHNPSTGLDANRSTVFRAIEQLLPGEAMEVRLPQLEPRIWRYWQVSPAPASRVSDEGAVFEEFRELLTDSVRLRMRSDVTLGSCLSGGLDSSAIVCIARRLLGDDVEYETFTGRFPGTPADEWAFASQVVEATRVNSHVTEPTVEGFVEELPEFLWFNELPVGSSSQYAQWCVFRLAKQHGVTVLLDGQGADEQIGGYEQYFASYVHALERRGESDRLAAELPGIRKRYPLALTPPARQLRDRLPFALRHRISGAFGMGTNLLYGLRIESARRLLAEREEASFRGPDALHRALAFDSIGGFLLTLLRYGDRNSMAHSREVRLPFCDHRIAEFVFALPPSLLMGEVQTKRLLRESMRGVLPEGVRTRWNKQGFRPPQDQWFRSERLLRLVRETFESVEFRESPCWDARWWLRALARVEAGELQLGWTLWSPFLVSMWTRHFLQRVAGERTGASVPRAAIR
jgi:asparagine synthase (glutamine-hydrolysing)